jgi:hypothetical protein
VYTVTDMAGRNGAAARLRAGLLLLVVMGVAGTALALAYERHWLSPWQLVPWGVIGIVGVATVALVVRQTALTVRLARAIAVLAILSAVLGTWQHVDANLNPDHDGHQHADHGESATTGAQVSQDHEEAEKNGHHHDDEGAEGDGHHHHDEESSSSDGHGSADEMSTLPNPSFADVLIGAVGHAPVPAALSLAPIGLALGMATIGLGGARRASQE